MGVNQLWSGAGEWHDNHHLFPTSVPAALLQWQLDSAFTFIRFSRRLGGVSSWRNLRDESYESLSHPQLQAERARQPTCSTSQDAE